LQDVLGARSVQDLAGDHFLATIEKSSTLKLRFRTLLDETEQRLGETLAADTNEPIDDPTARVVAALLTTIEWLLIQEFRSRLLAGQSGAKIRAALVRAVDRSFGIVRSEISDYARQKKDVEGCLGRAARLLLAGYRSVCPASATIWGQ
jgi:hypothetical protein